MIKIFTRLLTIITFVNVIFSIPVLSASLSDKPQRQIAQNVPQRGCSKTLRDVA